LLPVLRIAEGLPLLRAPTEGQDIAADYQSLGLTLGRHPLALLRARLRRQGISTAMELQEVCDEARVHTAGIVTTRQRPASAGGVTFVTLEDETGYVNLIVWRQLADRQRRVLLESRLLGVWGQVQRQGDVLHLVAKRLEDLSALLGQLPAPSRDFS
jgi:error-prone DNA polymerase